MHRILRSLLVFILLAVAGFAADTPTVAETKKNAEAGDAWAQYYLGMMYAEGEGVSKDGAEAVKWFRLAAEQGDAWAQYYLGMMYAEGEGVSKDGAEAVKWFRLAAEQGYANAQFNLGNSYYNGVGVPKDLVQAHVWINISAAKGNELAQKKMPILEEQMTSEQKAEAMKLARELFAKLPKGK